VEIFFIYPQWGSAEVPLTDFFKKIKENGYNGVEMGLPMDKSECREVFKLADDFELQIIVQHYHTDTSDFEAHREDFKRHLYHFAEERPLLINSHTGKDFFSFQQNSELILLAHEIQKETNIPILHETHRSRFSFAAHICEKFLEEFPFLELTADFSHWCCVSESLLFDQKLVVEKAINRTSHVHARVGSSQTAQVIDPRIDIFSKELEQFKTWWKQIILKAHQRKRPFLSFTPEYGPAPYQQVHPLTKKNLADQWEINKFIKQQLESIIKELKT